MIVTYNDEKILNIAYKDGTNKIIKFKTEEEAEDYAASIYDESIEYFTIE